MKITSFKVDKSQPAGTVKVGSGWKFDSERVLNTKSPLAYGWDHETGPLVEQPVIAPSFDVVQVADADTLKIAFFAAKNGKDEEAKEFTVSGAENVSIEAPEFAEGSVICTKPGVITITPNGIADTYFNIEYDGNTVFQVRQFVASDALGAPLVGGPYSRKAGNWKANE